jgi:hypothetical protein
MECEGEAKASPFFIKNLKKSPGYFVCNLSY